MDRTFFVTVIYARRPIFRNDRLAQLLVDVLFRYRPRHLLHEFVIMPDHVHLILTPDMTLFFRQSPIPDGPRATGAKAPISPCLLTRA